MGAFLGFVLVIALVIYAAYFAFLNTAAATFDPQTKMVTLYLWKGLTFLSAWELQTLALRARLWELVLFGAGGSAVFGWLIGWWMGRNPPATRPCPRAISGSLPTARDALIGPDRKTPLPHPRGFAYLGIASGKPSPP